ncbi:hypothetical protein F5Y03DRAFT_396687 [Xylaria venustula]|nr:hypothetical protein F5Y03DRAFT_396687 [Xylaria venustula]
MRRNQQYNRRFKDIKEVLLKQLDLDGFDTIVNANDEIVEDMIIRKIGTKMASMRDKVNLPPPQPQDPGPFVAGRHPPVKLPPVHRPRRHVVSTPASEAKLNARQIAASNNAMRIWTNEGRVQPSWLTKAKPVQPTPRPARPAPVAPTSGPATPGPVTPGSSSVRHPLPGLNSLRNPPGTASPRPGTQGTGIRHPLPSIESRRLPISPPRNTPPPRGPMRSPPSSVPRRRSSVTPSVRLRTPSTRSPGASVRSPRWQPYPPPKRRGSPRGSSDSVPAGTIPPSAPVNSPAPVTPAVPVNPSAQPSPAPPRSRLEPLREVYPFPQPPPRIRVPTTPWRPYPGLPRAPFPLGGDTPANVPANVPNVVSPATQPAVSQRPSQPGNSIRASNGESDEDIYN